MKIPPRLLYQRYAAYLTAVCSRYVSERDDVRDILQESFLVIFQKLPEFQDRGEGSLRAWMTRIVVNQSLGWLRKKGRLKFTDIDSSPDIADEPEADTESIPPEVIHRMISELPDGYRTVFNLYILEERSHKEISEMLGISEGTSASQLHRAKAMLAERIRQYRKSRQ